MPEAPEAITMVRWLKDSVLLQEAQTGQVPRACLKLFPRCFAGAEEEYCTLTTERLNGYSVDMEGPTHVDYRPNKYDEKRSKKSEYKYLIDQPLISGPLCFAIRGKNIVIAAGHHAVTVNFGPEAHMIPMSLVDFEEIISQDCAGANPDKSKANKLRSFPIPARFIEKGTHACTSRIINIFAAFITDEEAFVLVDFARLVRLHVTSSPHIWCEDDLRPGSQYWDGLWAPFPDGPDWHLERPLAEASLDNWRASVLGGVSTGLPIVDAIAGNESAAFGGFGYHLANDFLHLLGIFPNTPSYFICASDSIFDHIKSSVATYMEQFHSQEFRRTCGSRPNSLNPFAFNYTSDLTYTNSHILVYKRVKAYMDVKLYNRYLESGLFDPDHVMYTPYERPVVKATGLYKQVPVYVCHRPSKCYTVIAAKPHPDWGCDPQVLASKDITQGGYTTLTGPPQFREYKLNMIDVKRLSELVRRGRPARIQTGKRGRPRKTPTKASIALMESRLGRRKPPRVVDQTPANGSLNDYKPPDTSAVEASTLASPGTDNIGTRRRYKTRSRAIPKHA